MGLINEEVPMTKQEAFQIDAARGIPVCLIGMDHSSLLELVELLRENVEKTDAILAILGDTKAPREERDAADQQIEEIGALMEAMLNSQVIEIGDFELEALGLLVQKTDWPANPVTEEEIEISHMVDTLLTITGV